MIRLLTVAALIAALTLPAAATMESCAIVRKTPVFEDAMSHYQKSSHVCAAPSSCAQFFRYAPHSASAAFSAIVAWAHQTNSSKADFVAASRVASMSSMGLFAPIGEVDMKSPPGLSGFTNR